MTHRAHLQLTVTAEFPAVEPVAVTAWKLDITYRHSGRTEAVALVAPGVHYAAIRWPEAGRLSRQHSHVSTWRAALAELKPLEVGAVLTTGSDTLRLLVGDSTNATDLVLVEVQRVSSHPLAVAEALDALLPPPRET